MGLMMRRRLFHRLTRALLEAADDMQRLSLDAVAHLRITLRHTKRERRDRLELEKLLAGITPENLPDASFDDAPVGKEML